MHMLLKSKQVSFLGLLLAICVLLVYFGVTIEMNTLFFLCGASFLTGIARKECGISMGVGFFLASAFLCLILVPNKMYVCTFICMSLYVILYEILNTKVTGKKLLIIEFIIFNVIYIPIVIWAPSLVYGGKINPMIQTGVVLAGQVGFLVYRYVYKQVVGSLWSTFKQKFHIMD